MEVKMKFDIKLKSVYKNIASLYYSSEEEIKIQTIRLHELPYNPRVPEQFGIREDVINGRKTVDLPLFNDYVMGISFIVKDETHREQFSVGIDFSSKKVNVKEMMYER